MQLFDQCRKLFPIIIISIGIMNCTQKSAKISLDGEWQFAVDPAGLYHSRTVTSQADWREARVPLAWQVQFADLRDYQGIAWYRKTVKIPGCSPEECIEIEFKAVDYLAELYINNEYVGTHEGGYTPFSFDITDYFRPGDNVILLRVIDPADNEEGTEGIRYWHIPHGKQSWYVQSGGIWQSVRLHIRPRRHVEKIKVTSGIDGSFDLDVRFNPVADSKASEQLILRLLDPDQHEVFRKILTIRPVDSLIRISGRIEAPRRWHPDHPYLYTAEVDLTGKDIARTRFGFRRFEVKNGKFVLNGEPFYVIGALDQDFYPETNYTTPSEKYLRDEFRMAKELGLNLLRCHIKIPDERYLKVADEEGMLIWGEVPNWDVFSPEAARRASKTVDAMLDRDWNHPSLVIISLINESWGIDLQKAEQRAWLKEEYERVKRLAPDRVIVDNSACWGNFHLKTEINDYHTYWAIPENRANFDETVAAVAMRPGWLFSPFGDGEETGTEVLMISEFGNWGLPELPQNLPWWFERDFLGRRVTLPQGVKKRFDEFGYHHIFRDYNDLARESQRAQFTALKYEIERIRRESAIQGYVITEFTDINWECNGLLDMWRNPKIFAKELSKIQQPDLLIPQPERYTYREGDTIRIEIALSHFSGKSMTGNTVRWQDNNGTKGEFVLPPIERIRVGKVGTIQAQAPPCERPRKVRFTFQLISELGESITENWCDVNVFPSLKPYTSGAIALHDPRQQLMKFQRELNNKDYEIRSELSGASLLVTNRLDAEICDYLRKGGRVLALITDSLSLGDQCPYKIISREAEGYDGNWASNFNWIRSDNPLFRGFAPARHIGFEAAYTRPQVVITDIPAQHFSDVLAGMYVGWLHLNSGYIVQLKAGRGVLLLCTLDIINNYPQDPYAVNLLDRLLRYLAGDQIAPGLEWKL